MNQVVDRLGAMITKTTMTMEYYPTDEELGSDNINVFSNFSSLLHNFNEIKSTTTSIRQDANENILDLGIVTDELVNLIFNETNKGKVEKVKKQHILDNINNHGIIPQEIYNWLFYNWLLNDQNNLNSINLFGYFNYHGIGTIVNKQKAFESYQKAADLGNGYALFYLAGMYFNGKDVDKDYNKAIELTQKAADLGNIIPVQF